MRITRGTLGALVLLLTACAGADSKSGEDAEGPDVGARGADDPVVGCFPEQSHPYASLPWVGIHGNAANSDWIECQTGTAYQSAWHALRGLALTQPNTFSPDGSVIYATSANPT